MDRVAIGIDIGGTYIKSGLVGEDGRIREQSSTPTEASGGKAELLGKLGQIVQEYERMAGERQLELTGIGIGTAGYVALDGVIGSATDNLPGWQGTSLPKELKAYTSLPVFVENDVNAVAIGECWLGAGRGRDDFICLTLGTGIGGCLITGGKPYRGRNGYAGAYGHQTVAMNGQACTCGLRGCWEQYASVTALKRWAPDMADGAEWARSPEEIFAQARGGCETALRIVDRYAEYAAVGIANLIHSLNPTAIVIGGAISAQGEFLFGPIRRHVRRLTLHGFADEPELPVLPAKLGNMAGVIGAAKRVWMGDD
jgi:glucokinase